MAASLLEFAQISEALTLTTRKLEKRDLIAAWMRQLSPDDAALAALYFAGQPFAQTDRRALNLGGSLLSKAVLQLTAASPQALHEAYLRHGDLGSAAMDLWTARDVVAPTLTLAEVERSLTEIAAARGTQAKLHPLLSLLAGAMPLEAKYLIKLALGDMRTGVRESLIEDAIATAYSADPADVRRAGMLLGDLREVVTMAAAATLQQARMRLFHPLGFMLASPVASVDEAVARFATELAEEQGAPSDDEAVNPLPEPIEASELSLALIEDKYDGIRCQLHCGDAANPERVALFSRSREDLTESFPDLASAFAAIRTPIILDGEILAWDPTRHRAKPFSALQQRIGRKRVTRDIQMDNPVVFMAFDLLYADGDLLLPEPLAKRRSMLESLVQQWQRQTIAGPRDGKVPQQAGLFGDTTDEGAFPRLMLSPAVRLESPHQLDRAYAEARSRGNEGVMIKSRNSIYQPGRRGLAWLKLKRELATLDVVVTAAEFGHGKRAGVLSDYTFAVRDGARLLNVGKAYSGLTDAEIDALTGFFHEHTIEDFGRVRSVEPLIVLEVAFNNIMRSERHDSGFALRFPRILRIRDDKPVAEIDTLERVEEIYNSQPDKPQDDPSASVRDDGRERPPGPPE